MKNMDKILIFTFLLLFSCGQKSTTNEKALISVEKSENPYDFLNKYEYKEIPYHDSTNFDNHIPVGNISSNEIELLHLGQVYSKQHIEFDGSEIGIAYKLNLSEKFHTIVVYFYFTQQELCTTLINYDLNYNVISFVNVSMDEIAESLFRTESVINQSEIEITNYKYFEPPIIEKEFYQIKESGEIIANR